MEYLKEKEFIVKHMRLAFEKYSATVPKQIIQKSKFDLVTELDCNIEKYLIEAIKNEFPQDYVLSEEFFSTQKICDRTWTIDPIDGTCNFAHGMLLYGLQCALICNNEIVVSAIYLPHWTEEYYAIKGAGTYLNNKRIMVDKECVLENAIASFGDYSHKMPQHAKLQHDSILYLQQRIAKIRMFGAACIDFSFVASGKTDATVIMTKNIWDIAPGILLCKEAGAIVTNILGEKYSFGDSGIIAASTLSLTEQIIKSFQKK